MKDMRYYAVIMFFWVNASSQTFSSKPSENAWVTNGGVEVITQADNKAYIGGRFTYVGPNNGSFGVVDTITGELFSSFPKINGSVLAIIPDTRGGWYIGGTFDRVGSLKRNRIAHILPDFSVDTKWNPGAAYTFHIQSLCLHQNIVYAGGAFDTIGGQARENIACLNAETGLATDFNPGQMD